nr:hypothetical protein [Spirochaetota bacterium]
KTQSWDYVYKKSINGEWVESSSKKDGRILFDYQSSSYRLLKSNFENKIGTYKFDAVGNLTLDEVENYSFKRINESKVLLTDANGKKKLYEKVIKSEEKPYICGTWFCDKGLLIIYKNQKYFFKSYGSGIKYSGDYSLISDTILLKGDLMVMGSYNKNILSFGVGYDYKRIFDKSIDGEWNSLDKSKSEKIFFDVENEEYKIYDQKNAIASGKIYFEENNAVNLEGLGRFNLSVSASSLKAFEISSRKTYSYKREKVEYGGIWRGDMGLLIITSPDKYYYRSYGSDNASKGNYYVEDNKIILLGDTSEIGIYRWDFLNFGYGYDYKRIVPENISKKEIVGEWIGVNENANGLSIKFYKNGKFYYNYETKNYYINKNYIQLEGFKDIFIKSDKYLVFKTKDAEYVYEKRKIEDKEKVVKSKDKSSKKKMKKEKSSGVEGLWLCDNGILDLSDKKRYYFYNRVFGNPFKGWYEVKDGVIKLNGELVFTGNIVGEIIDFGSEFQYVRFDADKINFKKFRGVYKTNESEASFKEIEIKADNKLFIDKKEYSYFSGERFIKVFGVEGMLVASEDNIVHYSKDGEYLFSR